MADEEKMDVTNEEEQPDDSDVDEGEFEVEAILDDETVRGEKQYYIKWKNYGDDENTWEPASNLDCPDMIAKYHETTKKKEASTPTSAVKKRKTDDTVLKEKKSKDDNKAKEKKGFERGYDPDRIVGATDSSGELMFLMKWKNTDLADLVPSREANVKCPQIVIKFYEERLTWHTSEKK